MEKVELTHKKSFFKISNIDVCVTIKFVVVYLEVVENLDLNNNINESCQSNVQIDSKKSKYPINAQYMIDRPHFSH